MQGIQGTILDMNTSTTNASAGKAPSPVSVLCAAKTPRKRRLTTRTLFELRFYPSATAFSKTLSTKLREQTVAEKLVARYKARGVDAFAVPMLVTA